LSLRQNIRRKPHGVHKGALQGIRGSTAADIVGNVASLVSDYRGDHRTVYATVSVFVMKKRRRRCISTADRQVSPDELSYAAAPRVYAGVAPQRNPELLRPQFAPASLAIARHPPPADTKGLAHLRPHHAFNCGPKLRQGYALQVAASALASALMTGQKVQEASSRCFDSSPVTHSAPGFGNYDAARSAVSVSP
jgi:hypothetical protein